MKWVRQPNGKWKPYSKNVKEYNYYATYTYRDKIKKRLATVWVDCSFENCKECGGRYNLASPCPWHLSDSYEHNKQRSEFMKKIKQNKIKGNTVDEAEYKGLYE
jgi:rRNA maturation protein Nop10|tara:strand:+ start:260 stop:571 length:312 start_codon:yes stop_codon:yes gene_type:complete